MNELMPPSTPMNPPPNQPAALRAPAHPQCVVCSPHNPVGLGVEFSLTADGGVEGSFTGSPLLQGYPGWLHGGMIAALLDGAMTNCLFEHGYQAVTGELCVRYRHPVQTGIKVVLRAWLVESYLPLHLLRAELRQEGCLKATATAKFMEMK